MLVCLVMLGLESVDIGGRRRKPPIVALYSETIFLKQKY